MDVLNRLKNKALNLTTSPGVYLMKNSNEEIIYVGKAKNLKNRVVSYFRKNSSHNDKVKKMIENVDDFDFIVTDSEFEALVLECGLIKENKPKYNILLKDSKGYKYIKITNDFFPRILVCNKKSDDGARYLGPYVNSFSVKQNVSDVNRIFMLPVCGLSFLKGRKNKRPCLNFYIKRCMGLCQNKIEQKQYLKIVEEAVDYLKNGDFSYLEKMKKEMKRAAKEQDFEHAIRLRDKIKSIEKIHQTQKVFLNFNLNADVVSFFQSGDFVCFVILKIKNGKIYDKQDFVLKNTTGIENVKEEFLAGYYYKRQDIPLNIILGFEVVDLALYEKYLQDQAKKKVVVKIPKRGVFKSLVDLAYENCKEILNLQNKESFRENATLKELQKVLNLKTIPNYIESYDISNLGDSGIVGGMVVFKNGVPFKKNYRKFKIKTVAKKDDYSSMKEVLQRRIKRFKEKSDESFKIFPDLILVDGGKGHVLAVQKVFEEENFNLPCFGLVKDEKHKTRAVVSKDGEIEIYGNRTVFLFLTKIQDEVHRFTINYQKNVRKKENLRFGLTKIEGVGEKTVVEILKKFSSAQELKDKKPQELASFLKISLKKAERIINFLSD